MGKAGVQVHRRTSYLGTGIYSVAEAARLTRIPPSRIHRWLKGYKFHVDGDLHASPPVWRGQLPVLDGTFALGFLDLIELRFVDAFRKEGVSLHHIRLALDRARSILGVEHPFCSQKFRTDGRTIFMDIEDETEDAALLDLVKSQYAFGAVLEPYLRDLEFESDQVARWWPLGRKREVVIDPARSFGQPIVARDSVPTSVLAKAAAIEPIDAVARWYEVSPKTVRDAVFFEKSLAA